MKIAGRRVNWASRFPLPRHITEGGSMKHLLAGCVALFLLAPGVAAEKGSPNAELIAALKDRDPFRRRTAAAMLGLLGVDGRDGVPALVAAMKDPDEGVRRQAVRSLGEIGPPAADAVPVLIDAIQKPDLGADAVLALEGIGPAAVRSLGWALTDDSVAVRRAVAAVLRSIGPDAHEATPRLAAALKDPDAVVRL